MTLRAGAGERADGSAGCAANTRTSATKADCRLTKKNARLGPLPAQAGLTRNRDSPTWVGGKAAALAEPGPHRAGTRSGTAFALRPQPGLAELRNKIRAISASRPRRRGSKNPAAPTTEHLCNTPRVWTRSAHLANAERKHFACPADVFHVPQALDTVGRVPLTAPQRKDYTEDAEQFFAVMRRSGQWDGIAADAVPRWLNNFPSDSLRYFASRILRGLVYYSERDIGTLLKEGLLHQVLGQLVRERYQLASGFTCYPSVLSYQLRSHAERTLLVPLTPSDNPAESGPAIARLAEQSLAFPRSNICYPDQLKDRDFSNVDDVVLVDDNLGSGEQFREFWPSYLVDGRVDVGRFLGAAASRIHYLVLIATESALNQLRSNFPEVHFACAQRLPGSYDVFAPGSIYWPDLEEQNEARSELELHLAQFGVSLRGFEGLTYAVVLHNTIPDWCFPAFWRKEEDWFPLLTRRNSK